MQDLKLPWTLYQRQDSSAILNNEDNVVFGSGIGLRPDDRERKEHQFVMDLITLVRASSGFIDSADMYWELLSYKGKTETDRLMGVLDEVTK